MSKKQASGAGAVGTVGKKVVVVGTTVVTVVGTAVVVVPFSSEKETWSLGFPIKSKKQTSLYSHRRIA